MNVGLLSVEDAQTQLLTSLMRQANTEYLPISQACGRVLADNLVSEIDVPSADMSMMDGYAVDHHRVQTGQAYVVSQRIPAGKLDVSPLQENTIARIFTGAMMPIGATAVVMQEETNTDADGLVSMMQPIQAGQMIRKQGSDIARGQSILTSGKRLTSADIGLCASIGIDRVLVYCPLSVGLVTTGDELVEPGYSLAKGQTYNANRYLIQALLEAHGYRVKHYHCPDNREVTLSQFSAAATECDLVISTGGVSVGEEDHVRSAVDALGHIDAWKVRMKPGKPFAFGQLLGKQFFGLPGNPVAAFSTFHLFVLPALAQLQGLRYELPEPLSVIARFSVKAGDRRDYVRVKLAQQDHQLIADIYPNQASSALVSVSWADAFAIVPEGQTIQIGDSVSVIPFSAFVQ